MLQSTIDWLIFILVLGICSAILYIVHQSKPYNHNEPEIWAYKIMLTVLYLIYGICVTVTLWVAVT